MLLAIQSAAFLAATLAIVALTAGGRVHVFVALVVAALGYGLLVGMGPAYVFRSIGDGCAAGFADVGMFVLTGAIVARILNACGGLPALAADICKRLGDRSLRIWVAAVAACLGIVASVEAAFLLLGPLVGELARRARNCPSRLQLLLALALSAGHSLLLPAPGVVIAMTVLAADIGLVLLFGIIAAAAATFTALAFVTVVGGIAAFTRDAVSSPAAVSPPLPHGHRWRSALPLAVPLLLLSIAVLGHVAGEPLGGGANRHLLLAAGAAPTIFVVAVALSIWAAVGLRRRIVAERGLLADAMIEAAPLVFAVVAALAYARVLQNSGLPDVAAEALVTASFGTPIAAPLVLAFAVSAVLKTAQGSSLVAMISAAGIVEPFLATSGDGTRALAVVAIGAGATVVSHANDGYFWVVIRSLGLTPWQGYRTLTLGSLITGGSAFIVVLLLGAVAG